MTEQRDPRVNPRPGDVLRKKYQGQYFESRGYNERQVDEVYDGADGTGRRVIYVGSNVCTPEISIASWRKWAKTAKVIICAD